MQNLQNLRVSEVCVCVCVRVHRLKRRLREWSQPRLTQENTGKAEKNRLRFWNQALF